MSTNLKLLDKHDYRYRFEKAGFKCVWDPYTNGYKLGLNMDPYTGLCDGLPCPCNKGHYLEATTEPIVMYKDRIWAYRCATTEALVDSAAVLIEVIEAHDRTTLENHRVTLTNAQLKECIQDLAAIVKDNISHEEGCVMTNAAALMRGRSECTCNLKNAHVAIDKIIAKAKTMI